jgi:sulfoxide reductase heme-binding subunit YedZ
VAAASVLVPFSSAFRPFWIGLGTLAAQLVAALVVTSLLRKRLSPTVWRGIHWAAYAAWPLAVLHGLGAGSDSTTWWLMGTTLACVAVVLTGLLWRAGALDEPPQPAGG